MLKYQKVYGREGLLALKQEKEGKFLLRGKVELKNLEM